eukprot:scaffold519_cov99-Amphora_coffeaeformis.AAC.1
MGPRMGDRAMDVVHWRRLRGVCGQDGIGNVRSNTTRTLISPTPTGRILPAKTILVCHTYRRP